MTWIVGTPSFFGYAIGISDIRVTFANGRTLDCLQKVYPVGRFIAAGFSGSVAFGFAALKNLSTLLDHVAPDEAWIPGWVAFKWHRHARRMFARAPLEIQRLGAEIMLLGVSPMVDLGIPGFARPTVAIMRSPDFSPQILPISIIGSIGNGAAIPAYVQSLQELNNDRNLMRLEVNSPGG